MIRTLLIATELVLKKPKMVNKCKHLGTSFEESKDVVVLVIVRIQSQCMVVCLMKFLS